MAISTTFGFPLGISAGSATSDLVPDVFPVAIDGRPYMVDMKSERFMRRSIPLQREQSDSSETPAEHTLNRSDAWRRAIESWHHGAGQTVFDRDDSDRARFRSSKGVNPWTQWQLTLLGDTANRRSSANTNLAMVTVGTRLYVTDGSEIRYTTDMSVASPTFTNVTGVPAAAPVSIASDGYSVFTAHSASGIYLSNRTISTTASWITGTVTLVRYVKGRLMAANAASVYNVTTSTGTAGPTALPAVLFTHGNSDFTWVDFAEGPSNIYMAGYSGDKSLIYKTAVVADGTALSAPTVAGELPDGEIIRSMQGYLGFLVLGTDKGVRFASVDSSGNLTIGSLIPTTTSVYCFEPQDRFVWFGYSNYDGTSTGLGRMDLSVFTSPLTPAYASDLMATGQGAVTACVTFQNVRHFAVSGVGFFSETAVKVTSGTLDSGLVTYGLPDIKVALFVDVRHRPLVGSFSVALSADGGSFVSLGTHDEQGGTVMDPFPGDQTRAETFELRSTLARLNSSDTTGPTVTRLTLRSYPAPARGEQFIVPLLLYETLDINGAPFAMEPEEEVDFIVDLARAHTLVTYQEGVESHEVFVDDYEWHPHHKEQDGSFWAGTLTVVLSSLAI